MQDILLHQQQQILVIFFWLPYYIYIYSCPDKNERDTFRILRSGWISEIDILLCNYISLELEKILDVASRNFYFSGKFHIYVFIISISLLMASINGLTRVLEKEFDINHMVYRRKAKRKWISTEKIFETRKYK